MLVVGPPVPARSASEAVLAKLRFAVATSDAPDDALRLIPALRPDVVVAAAEDVPDIRGAAPDDLPVVVMRDDPDLLVQAIRRSLS